MKEETLTALCQIIEDFMAETGQQDVDQNFDTFIKWLRMTHYKKFLTPNNK